MAQKIKVQAIFEIPEDKVIIDRSEYEELKNTVDEGEWWTTKDLEFRYNHKLDWFKSKLFYIPKYKEILSTEFGGCVHYSDNDNGRYWSFEPKRFKKFMSEHFTEINQ